MTMQYQPGPHGRPPPPGGARPPQQSGARPGAPPMPIPSMQAHFDALLEQGEHALVGAAEIMLEHLRTSMVVVRARFPEVPPGTPEFRGIVLGVNEQLLRLSAAIEEASDGAPGEGDGQGGEGEGGYAPEGAELPAGDGDDGQGEGDGFDE